MQLPTGVREGRRFWAIGFSRHGPSFHSLETVLQAAVHAASESSDYVLTKCVVTQQGIVTYMSPVGVSAARIKTYT